MIILPKNTDKNTKEYLRKKNFLRLAKIYEKNYIEDFLQHLR